MSFFLKWQKFAHAHISFSLKFVKNLIFSKIYALYAQNDLIIQKMDKTTK